MSPQVTAAWSAASVSFLTLIGTLAAQFVSRRATRHDLEVQRQQLDRTLDEQHNRTLNNRFATAAGQLGSDKAPAVRLAGVYAMASLADDWPENRQTCIDVLCGYLRLPYDPDPGEDTDPAGRAAYQANREVRHTVIRVISAHLQADMAKAKSWQGRDFDFTRVVFDGGDFTGAVFSRGTVNFTAAEFIGAKHSGTAVFFTGATFSGGTVYFAGARFSGLSVYFSRAVFSDGMVNFGGALFDRGKVSFSGAVFSGGTVRFGATLKGGEVDFSGAVFSGGTVIFGGAVFHGSRVDFTDAEFSGGTVDFSRASDWSSPPVFPWTDTLSAAPGVKLPEKDDQSQT
jgi:hypothetical protein